jgi:hypothetical protein
MKLPIMQFSPTTHESSPFSPIFFSTSSSQIPSVYLLTLTSDIEFQIHKKLQAKSYFSYFLCF